VLNHILTSYIATVASEFMNKSVNNPQPDITKSIKKSLAILNDTSKKLGGEKTEIVSDRLVAIDIETKAPSEVTDDGLLKEQLGFINKISLDIARVAENVAA